jgi:hypothetical protein
VRLVGLMYRRRQALAEARRALKRTRARWAAMRLQALVRGRRARRILRVWSRSRWWAARKIQEAWRVWATDRKSVV